MTTKSTVDKRIVKLMKAKNYKQPDFANLYAGEPEIQSYAQQRWEQKVKDHITFCITNRILSGDLTEPTFENICYDNQDLIDYTKERWQILFNSYNAKRSLYRNSFSTLLMPSANIPIPVAPEAKQTVAVQKIEERQQENIQPATTTQILATLSSRPVSPNRKRKTPDPIPAPVSVAVATPPPPAKTMKPSVADDFFPNSGSQEFMFPSDDELFEPRNFGPAV